MSYDAPTYVASEPDDPDRLFVTEQAGTIIEVTPGGEQPFLDLTDRVVASGEQGLWSIAFAPGLAEDGRFYVAYSSNDGDLTLDEYRERANPAATEGTRRQVLAIPNTASTNHNGGQLQFGPDGYLYWSTGDDAVAAAAGDGQVLRLEGPSGGACPPQGPAPPDTSPPQTTLELEAQNRRRGRVVVALGADEPGSTFECRLGRRAWRSCSERERLKRLRTGRHRFRARATDQAGNTDPTPAKRRFRVKPRRSPPGGAGART